jgi:phage-related minor tail protein
MDAMQEQRDHVRIRISIIENGAGSKPERLSDASRELAELEQEIEDHRAFQRKADVGTQLTREDSE